MTKRAAGAPLGRRAVDPDRWSSGADGTFRLSDGSPMAPRDLARAFPECAGHLLADIVASHPEVVRRFADAAFGPTGMIARTLLAWAECEDAAAEERRAA